MSLSATRSGRRAAIATVAGAGNDAVSAAPRPEWVADIAARLPPRFSDAPSEYWTGGARGVGGTQVHGPDTILGLLHGAGAFHHPALHVDVPNAEVLLTLRTGARTAGHPGWTHGGFARPRRFEIAGVLNRYREGRFHQHPGGRTGQALVAAKEEEGVVAGAAGAAGQ